MNRRRRPAGKVLRPVHANAGIEAEYRRRLNAAIEEMHRSVIYWISAAYRGNEPRVAALAEDESPAAAMAAMIRVLVARWRKRFNKMADDLGSWFAQATADRSDDALRKILRDGGMSVRFTMTRAMRDVMTATIQQQVGLIKSIPQQYLGKVETLVMQSVQTGRDLGALTKALQGELGVTKRRAALIARDQNSRATASMSRARLLETGITTAVWLHSHAGKKPRRTHVAMNGKTYDVAKGMWDEDERAWVLPGQLINCRCVAKPIIPGFS